MKIVQAQHDLIDNICGLALGEVLDLCKSIEELASFDEFWDDIAIFIILQEVNDPDQVGMRLLSKQWQLVLQELLVYFFRLNSFLRHDFDCEGFACVFVATLFDDAEGSFAQLLALDVSWFDILYFFESFVIVHV